MSTLLKKSRIIEEKEKEEKRLTEKYNTYMINFNKYIFKKHPRKPSRMPLKHTLNMLKWRNCIAI